MAPRAPGYEHKSGDIIVDVFFFLERSIFHDLPLDSCFWNICNISCWPMFLIIHHDSPWPYHVTWTLHFSWIPGTLGQSFDLFAAQFLRPGPATTWHGLCFTIEYGELMLAIQNMGTSRHITAYHWHVCIYIYTHNTGLIIHLSEPPSAQSMSFGKRDIWSLPEDGLWSSLFMRRIIGFWDAPKIRIALYRYILQYIRLSMNL